MSQCHSHTLPKLNTATESAKVQLATLEDAFASETDRLIGVELEFYLVDAKTGVPVPLFEPLYESLPEDVRRQVSREHLNCQIEIISTPSRTLRELRDQLQSLLDTVGAAAAQLEAKLLWGGCHPSFRYDSRFVGQSPRNGHNLRRLGALTRQLQTCGVHFHVGVTRDEAIPVIDGLQDYIPLLVALAANSPIMGNEDTGRRSQRAAIWSSGFAVCGLSGPHRNWENFNRRIQRLGEAKRIEEVKDLYDFIRPTRYSTVEVRCCDMPGDLDQVTGCTELAD